MISEGKIKLNLDESVLEQIPTMDMDVFYNPVMVVNRDISLLLIKSLKQLGHRMEHIALPTCGSGVRGVRFLKNFDDITVHFNDLNKKALKNVKQNLRLNKLKKRKARFYNLEANEFLVKNRFDYVDIDPFGSPNFFLENSIRSLTHKGILAVTATDTAAFMGTYPSTALRKYNVKNKKSSFMYEFSLRILIKHVISTAASIDCGLEPIYYHVNDHYIRAYFIKYKSKNKALKFSKMLKNVALIDDFNFEIKDLGEKYDIGPLYTGKLKNYPELSTKILKNSELDFISKSSQKLISKIHDEKDIFGYYDLHKIAKHFSKDILSTAEVLSKIDGSKTHFSNHAIKTENEEKLFKLFL